MMKKCIPVLILAVVLSLFSGCGGKKETGSSAASRSVPAVDLGGYEFVIASAYTYGEVEELEMGQSDLNDAIIARDKEIEQKFNCKISYDYYDPRTFFDAAYASIMSGEKFADIIASTLFATGRLYSADQLYNLAELPGIKFEDPWWIKEFTEKTTFKNGTFGLNCQMFPWQAHLIGVHYNKRILETMGLDDPAGLIESKQWTWDVFKDMVGKSAKDLDGNGVFDEKDQWACSSAVYDGIVPFFLSSGKNMMEKDQDKNVKYVLDNAEALGTLVKLKNIFSTPGAMYMPNFDYAKAEEQYISGKCAFFISGVVPLKKERDMADPTGIVPAPIGPYADSYISGADHNTPIITVPKTIDNPKATGTVLNALAEASQELEDVWYEDFSAGYRDEKTVKIIKDYVFTSPRMDIAMLVKLMSDNLSACVDLAVGKPIIGDPNTQAIDIIKAFKDGAQQELDQIFG